MENRLQKAQAKTGTPMRLCGFMAKNTLLFFFLLPLKAWR